MRKGRRFWFIIVTICFFVLGLIVFFWWLFFGRFVKTTRDAYVNGNQVRVTSQIFGYITAVYADDTQLVQKGQILLELDKTDAQIAFEQSKARLAESVRKAIQLFGEAHEAVAAYQLRKANKENAEIYYLDRKAVLESGAIAQEEFIRAETEYIVTQAQLAIAKYKLMQAISEVKHTTIHTHPLVEQAKVSVREAFVNLQRCIIRAPTTGIVALRRAQVGQAVSPNVPLLAVVPLDQIWIDANFREIDLGKLYIGQSAKVTSDVYGRKVVYVGRVVGISMGSGAVFSPLPPQNATGNWIKIVQRFPVRIAIDMQKLSDFPLRLGLSMKVKVNIRDGGDHRIPFPRSEEVLYDTDIFSHQLSGAEEVIQQVLQENESFLALESPQELFE